MKKLKLMDAEAAVRLLYEALKDGNGVLYQVDAVDLLERAGHKDCLYENDSGNQAISRSVLQHFRKLTEATVVWDRGDLCWRSRETWDSPGRMAD